MTISAAKLQVEVGADTSGAERGLHQLHGDVDSAASGMSGSFGGIGTAGALAFGAIATAGGAALGLGMSVAADNEQAEISYGKLLGSVDAAKGRMQELVQFNNSTPFELSQIIQMDQAFLNVGMSADGSKATMKSLSDIISAIPDGAARMPNIVSALTQVQRAGKVTTEDLNQLSENGVDAWGAVAQATGQSGEALRDMVSSGQVGSEVLIGSITNMTGPFEKLKGLSEAQSQSLSGMWTTMKDTLGQGLGDILTPVMGPIKDLMGKLSPLIGGIMEKLGPSIGPVFEKLGAVVIKLAEAFGPVIEKVIPALADALVPILDALMPIIDALAPVIATLADVFAQIMEALGPLIGQLVQAFAPIIQALAPIIIMLLQALMPIIEPLLKIATIFVEMLTPVLKTLAPVITTLVQVALMPLMAVLDGLGKVIGWVADWFGKFWEVSKQLWEIMGPKLGEALRGIVDWFKQIPEKIGNLLQTLWDKGKELITGLWNGITAAVENVWQWFRDLPGNIWNFVKDIGKWLLDAGKYLVEGLWNGISGAWNWLWDQITGFLDDMWNGIMDWFGISSPSKKMMTVGHQLTMGLARGITDGASVAVDAALSTAAAVSDAMSTVATPTVTVPTIEPPTVAAGAALTPAAAAAATAAMVSTPVSSVVSGPVTVVLQVDRRKFGEITLESLNRFGRDTTAALTVAGR